MTGWYLWTITTASGVRYYLQTDTAMLEVWG
jgi:hypothetical protein